ncbi:hypothetical protein N4X08_004159 [Salmonella enterica]|nr:hypothetical protein [Salmonella enterica]
MSNENPTHELKARITLAIDNYKGASKKLPLLLVESARHYWNNSNSPDVMNHFIMALEDFPRLQNAAYQAIKTFGKFDVHPTNGKILNKRDKHRPDRKTTYTEAEKTKYHKAIDDYEAANYKSLLHFGKEKPKSSTFDFKKAQDRALASLKSFIVLTVQNDDKQSGSKLIDLLTMELIKWKSTIDKDVSMQITSQINKAKKKEARNNQIIESAEKESELEKQESQGE